MNKTSCCRARRPSRPVSSSSAPITAGASPVGADLEGRAENQPGLAVSALHRLELRGEVTSEMTASGSNRRARVYTITRARAKTPEPETETGRNLRRCGAFCGADDARLFAHCVASTAAGLTERSPRSFAITWNARLRHT